MIKMIKMKKNYKNLITIAGLTILLALLIINFGTKEELIYDFTASSLTILIFFIFYKKLNQDKLSYTMLILALILHNLVIYETSPLGIRFDHYMHFFAGLTLAIIGDRIFNEKFSKLKRFIVIILFALGLGAIGEIIEWIGYGVLRAGHGFFFYGIGDEGEWQNAMLDLIFNFAASALFAFYTIFRKPKKQE
jgi:uncharacterized membrane protein YjdF